MTAAGCPEDAAKEKERDKLTLPDDGPSKHTGKGDKSDPSDSTENTKQTVTRFLIDIVSPELSCFVQEHPVYSSYGHSVDVQ